MNIAILPVNILDGKSLGILLIRIAVAAVFVYNGWLKISGMDATIAAFGSLGIPAFLAYFVSYAELVGGMAVFLGIAVRYASVVLSVIMLVATAMLFKNGFSLAGGGYEYTFVLMFVCLALAALGSGKYSLDKIFSL